MRLHLNSHIARLQAQASIEYPPLSLHLHLPHDYPSARPPQPSVEAPWLAPQQALALAEELLLQWDCQEGQRGSAVCYEWISWLKTHALSWISGCDVAEAPTRNPGKPLLRRRERAAAQEADNVLSLRLNCNVSEWMELRKETSAMDLSTFSLTEVVDNARALVERYLQTHGVFAPVLDGEGSSDDGVEVVASERLAARFKEKLDAMRMQAAAAAEDGSRGDGRAVHHSGGNRFTSPSLAFHAAPSREVVRSICRRGFLLPGERACANQSLVRPLSWHCPLTLQAIGSKNLPSILERRTEQPGAGASTLAPAWTLLHDTARPWRMAREMAWSSSSSRRPA